MAEQAQLTELDHKSSEEEFIPFFLDNLRSQLTTVIENFTGYHQIPVKNQPVKLILDQSQCVNTSNCKIESTEPNKRVMSELNETIDILPLEGETLNDSKSFSAEDSFNLSNSPSGCSKEPTKVKNLTKRKKVKLISSSPSHSNKIDPAFKFEDSFPSLNKSNQSISEFSVSMDKSTLSDLDHSNCSPKNNKIVKTPDSPLYVSPLNSARNKSHDSYLYNSHSQQCITSTPNNRTQNASKSFNSRSPLQINLGDYFQNVNGNSKKLSAKKKRTKSKCENQTENPQKITFNEQNIIRKVNPTRVDLTSEKGKEESTFFRGIAKSFTQNPQFTNVPTITKSDESASFQDERSLLKKQKEKTLIKLADQSISKENEKPKLLTVYMSPSKAVPILSIITPNIELVKNKEALNRLAEVYSRFLNQNLVVNSMSELYLIITIVTTQYKDNNQLISAEHDKLKTNDNVKINNNNNKSFDELQCLKDEASLIEDIKQMNIESNKSVLDNQFNYDQTEEKVDKNLSFKEWNTLKNCVQTYLNTPHDCVYFASKVLDYQRPFLKCLNRPTLKLLSENKNIELFQPQLCEYLNSIYRSKIASEDEIKSVNMDSTKSNVCFQTDEDNSENFTSISAFQCFKKQRDIFYEILKMWEDHHLEDGWSFKVLKGEIRKMLLMDVDGTNCKHLTRLFKSQMLNSCINIGQQEDLLYNGTTDFLKNLKDVNSEKLSLLNQKLVTPLSQKGPVPLPSFPGIQEFYKDFIIHAAHSQFYTHLEDTFIHEILEVNNSQFTSNDIEEAKSEVDKQTKHKFSVCLSSLGILGKFLGFLISLPYRSSTSLQYVSNPSYQTVYPSRINLQYLLYNAIINGKLSLTVPWIVEYFAMLDDASFQLPYYKRILEILYCIYRVSCYGIIFPEKNSVKSMSQETIFLIKLVTGWLFDLPKFPKELYHHWQSKYSDKSLKVVRETLYTIIKYETSLEEADKPKDFLFLDKLDLIDDRVLYDCCPFLKELHILLIPGGSRLNNSSKSKHVTPVTYQLQKSTKKTSTKNLEIELEKSFFNGQPESTRKTVEYVSERIASSCRKYIYKNILPTQEENLFNELKKIIQEKNINIRDNPETVKNLLAEDMILLSEKASKNINETIQAPILKYCEFNVANSIEALLAQDCLVPVKNMCVKIAVRMTMERVNHWINSRIVEGLVFMKHIESELGRYCKSNDEENVSNKCHNSNAASPTEVLNNLRKFISNIMETQGQSITEENLSIFWDQLHQSLTERSDLKRTTQKTIVSFSFDLCLFLIIHRVDLLTVKFREKMFNTWKLDQLKLREADSPLSRLLCPRNMVLMEQSKNYYIWSCYGNFLKELLRQDILTITVLYDQVVSVRESMSVNYRNWITVCLIEAIKDCESIKILVSDEETEALENIKKIISYPPWVS